MTEEQNSLIGRWTVQEHEKFLLGLQLYGKDWRKIEELVVTRNSSQIRSHAQKYFLKLKKQSKRKPNNLLPQIKSSLLDTPSQNQSPLSKQNISCSYFMNKIIQFTRSHENLDIWEALIDNKSPTETVTKLQKEGNSKNMTIQDNFQYKT